MKLVYLAAPLSPAPDETVTGNIDRAKAIYRQLCLEHPAHVFLMPWLLNCEVFEDTPEFRKKGMERNFEVIKRCQELWLVGPRISKGMDAEAKFALEWGIEVKCLVPGEVYGTEDCPKDEHVLEGPAGRMICRRCGWAEWDDEG